MKKIIIGLVVLALGAGIFYSLSTRGENVEAKLYTDEVLGISFEYPVGYAGLEMSNSTSTPEIIKTVVFIEEAEYQSILNGERDGGEGPPSLVILGHSNPSGLSPDAWAEANAPFSSYNLKMGEVTEIEVDGERAISYESDGLYPNRNVIFAYNGRIYLLNGSYLERDSEIYRDFDRLIDSIELGM